MYSLLSFLSMIGFPNRRNKSVICTPFEGKIMRVEQFVQLGQIYLLIQISHLPKKRNKVLEKMKVFEMQK